MFGIYLVGVALTLIAWLLVLRSERDTFKEFSSITMAYIVVGVSLTWFVLPLALFVKLMVKDSKGAQGDDSEKV